MDMQANYSLVLTTLQRAASQDAQILKPAESRLKEWETVPGFYSILLNIFSNYAIDVNVRWLAVLYFKNGIDRYWRKTAPNAIAESEKPSLRQGLIANFQEPVNQVATQISVLISKIARFDCPRDWPELIPTLLNAVKEDNALVQYRALVTFHHVVKTLSSKRLAGDRRLFQELTDNLYSFMLQLWNAHVEGTLHSTPGSMEFSQKLEKSLLSLRILRKLTVHGFKKPHESQDVVFFITVIFQRVKTMLELRNTLCNHGQLNDLCEKFIIHLTKVLYDVLEHHPFSYLEFIKPTLEFSVYYTMLEPLSNNLVFERFIIQCLNLIKGILLCVEYKPSGVLEVSRVDATHQAHKIKRDFFDESTLNIVCHKLVTHYFLLTQEDLRLWDTDPESFATDEGGESWKYSLRPSTEALFLAVFREFRTELMPVLLDMIRKNHALVPPSDLNGILHKDAVYNAVGLAVDALYDDVDFDTWFATTLREELKVKDPNYRIIRRRVVLLLGQWSAKISTELRPMLYDSIIPLLQCDEDMAVRIAASATLKLAIDDFEFNTEQFLCYLEPAFRLLFCLLKEAQECDTKMHVLYVLSFIIERVGMAIRPHAGSLIQYLPILWQESAEYNMLRCAIVSTLVHLVQALGAESQAIATFLLPVIALSTDVTQDSHVYLLEDGLELWLAVLENTPGLTHDLLTLFQNMPPLLEIASENLQTCFFIVQAYILLEPETFLKSYGSIVIATCNDMLSDMKSEGIIMTMRLVEMCLRAVPGRVSAEIASPMIPRILKAIYQGEDHPMVMSMYLSVIARIILCSRDSFAQSLSQMAHCEDVAQEDALGRIIDVYLDRKSLITQQERRKLLGLALASLLTSCSPAVLDRFCGILLNTVEVLNDIMKTDNFGLQVDSLVVSPADLQVGDEGETEHDHRRRQLAALDPVHNIVLRDYFQEQINQLQVQAGSLHFEQLMQTVDCETLKQVRDYIQV